MQFLWKHFTELVGKGIGIDVISEFFLYATASLVPLALPLAILLASLMTFGNMGENFELTAMKSAGISLFRIIRPLIILISLICVGAFFFSNDVLPKSQTKLWTLIFSLREKSPELDIPVGEFYSGINGYNIYVRGKKNGMLENLMIYDFSNGFDNETVMVADSGKVQVTADKKHLLLSLYNGESFENLKKQRISESAASVPYRRETFKTKIVLLDFDSGFNRLSESILSTQQVSKNLRELSQTIDSVRKVINFRKRQQAFDMVHKHYFERDIVWNRSIKTDSTFNPKKYNPDSLFMSLSQLAMENASKIAINKATQMKDQIVYNGITLGEPQKYMKRHQIELERKFTLSFACLIFFFIGAPLGAIIRKGGLGTPVVISVIMFIIYYIIDNTGYKMCREGLWTAFEGMWLSSAVLLPVGIFLTYKAAIDATLFDPDSYIKMWKLIVSKFNKITKYFFVKKTIKQD